MGHGRCNGLDDPPLRLRLDAGNRIDGLAELVEPGLIAWQQLQPREAGGIGSAVERPGCVVWRRTTRMRQAAQEHSHVTPAGFALPAAFGLDAKHRVEVPQQDLLQNPFKQIQPAIGLHESLDSMPEAGVLLGRQVSQGAHGRVDKHQPLLAGQGVDEQRELPCHFTGGGFGQVFQQFELLVPHVGVVIEQQGVDHAAAAEGIVRGLSELRMQGGEQFVGVGDIRSRWVADGVDR